MEPDDLLCSRNARPQKDEERPDALLARRTRTMKLCSSDDAPVEGSLGHSLREKWRKLRPSCSANGTSREIDCNAIGGYRE